MQKSMIDKIEQFLDVDQEDHIAASGELEANRALQDDVEPTEVSNSLLYSSLVKTMTGVKTVTSATLSYGSAIVGKLTKGTAFVSFWILSQPRAAKITLFIARRVLRDMCNQVHRKINEATYSHQHGGKPRPIPRAGLSDIPGIRELTKDGGELVKVATFEGARDAITNNFDNIWEMGSGIVAGATEGLIGSVPFGGVITGAAKGMSKVMKESCKFGAEVAMFESDMHGAFGNLMDIICDILPGAGSQCWNINQKAGGSPYMITYKFNYKIMDL